MSLTGPPPPPVQQVQVPTPLGGYFTQSNSLKEGDWGYGGDQSFMGGPTTPGPGWFGPQGPVSTDASAPGTGGPPFSPPSPPRGDDEYCHLIMTFKGSLLTKGKNGGANMEGGGQDAAGNPQLGFGCENGKPKSCVMLKGIIEIKCICMDKRDDTGDESGRDKKGKVKDRSQKKLSYKGRGNCDMVGGDNNFETGHPNHVFEGQLNADNETGTVAPGDPANDSPSRPGGPPGGSAGDCKKKRGPKIEWQVTKQLKKCKEWDPNGAIEANVSEQDQTMCGPDDGGYLNSGHPTTNPAKAPCGYKKCRLCLNIAICIPIGCGKKKGPNGTKAAHDYAGSLRFGSTTYGDQGGTSQTAGGSQLDGFDDKPEDGTNPNKKCKRMKNLAAQCNPCSNAKDGKVIDHGYDGISDDAETHDVNDGNSKEGTRDLLKEIARDMLHDMFGDDLQDAKSCEEALKKLLDTLKEAGNSPQHNLNRWNEGQGDARNGPGGSRPNSVPGADQPFGPSHAKCKSASSKTIPNPGGDDC